MLKNKSIISLLILCLFLVMAIGSTSDSPVKADPNDDNNTNNPPQTETFEIGDRVKLGDFYITVKKAYISTGSNEWNKPDQGKKWVVIDVEIENASDKPQTISSLLMFNLYDEDNYKCDYAINTAARGSLDGELGVGRKMAGEITFSVPADQSNFEFIFEPNIFGTGQAIYKLKNLGK